MTTSTPQPPDAPLAIVQVAMADEAAPFLARATWVGEPDRAGEAVIRPLVIDGLPLLLVHSGIGFVNASSAITTAIVRAREAGSPHPLVVSAGTAGGLGAGVVAGDVVVGSRYINLDADARVFGYLLGQVPGMPAVYDADERMLAALPELAPAEESWSLHAGLIASSYSFVTGARAEIARESFPEVMAVDMESSAIAQICYSNQVAFASVRGISDLATDDAPDDHVDNTDLTSDRSALVALALLREALRPR
ncbi:5'-methylthioadenosine/S-adenosylhomocysteine nucleosidase [Herbiconiux sp. P18]|uniref:5'-methylthioadenosine/S-adenosylhomocysteine nucleosidase n=1 Tax=Herbiconiux liangxiaofengii TaxID=3342795 RepID=UPI0035B713F8